VSSDGDIMSDPSAQCLELIPRQYDQMIGEPMRIIGARGKVPSELLAYRLDRTDEAFAGVSVRDLIGEIVDDPLPNLLAHTLVDRGVGEDLGKMLRRRDEDEDPCASGIGVKVLCHELVDGTLMGPGMLDGFRHERQS
jgi:hypothetical protein